MTAVIDARPAVAASRFSVSLDQVDKDLMIGWGVAYGALLTAAWAAGSAVGHPLALQQWDGNLLQSIAQYGYFGGPGGHPDHPNQVAFFPGYPLTLRVAHVFLRSWIASELAVSFVAGAAALLLLRRIADTDRAPRLLLLAPAAVFLMVGYAESLFLALSLAAWLCATRDRWALAALLAGAASTVRVNGLFLLAALAVLALQSKNRLRNLAKLAPALLGPWLYEVWMHGATGDWDAWRHAEKAGWGRANVGLLQSFKTSWSMAFPHGASDDYTLMSRIELGSVLMTAVLFVVLLATRRWAEAVYVGLTLYSLASSTFYESVPRALLLMFPLWSLLGRAAERRPWVGRTYLAVSAPLCAVTALAYLTGQWSG